MNAGALVSVEGLGISMPGAAGRFPVVENASFSIAAGEALALVGESGCGKSVTGLAMLRLLPEPAGRIESGKILFGGEDVLAMDNRSLRAMRGRKIGMIFQEPMTSLNPVFTIGAQIAETLTIHRGLRGAAAAGEAARLLDRAGIPGAKARLKSFPHEISGGQRQRVMIAMALACSPKLLIADEPTTALDVTVQAQILKLIDDLRRDLGMAVLLITHDLGVVAETCERVAVMYAGRIVEVAKTGGLFATPRHPYTRALLNSMPSRHARGVVLPSIPGQVPPPHQRGKGCRFAPRCGEAFARCHSEEPDLIGGAACWLEQRAA